MIDRQTKSDADVIFLRCVAEYFENLSVDGEDRAYWANIYNAENCRRIADRLDQPTPPATTPASKVAEMIVAPISGEGEKMRKAMLDAVLSLEWWQRNEPNSFGNIEAIRLEAARAALATTPARNTSQIGEG